MIANWLRGFIYLIFILRAAIGGLSGGAIGEMRSSRQNRQADQQQQQWEQQQANQYMQQRNAYTRAHAACLEGRGYTVN